MKKFTEMCESILSDTHYSSDPKRHGLHVVLGGSNEIISLSFKDDEEAELRKQIEAAKEAHPVVKSFKHFEIDRNEKPGWLIVGGGIKKNIVKTKDGYRVFNVSKNFKPDYGVFKTAKEAAEVAVKAMHQN